jgi:hypothetical protein
MKMRKHPEQQVEYYLKQVGGISGPPSVSYGPSVVSTSPVTVPVLPSNHPFVAMPPSTVVPFSPTQISGCCLWLDGNDPAGSGIQPSAGALSTSSRQVRSNNNMTAVGTTPTFSNYPPGAVAFGGAEYTATHILFSVTIIRRFLCTNRREPAAPCIRQVPHRDQMVCLQTRREQPILLAVTQRGTQPRRHLRAMLKILRL